jgi:MATE family multidrug resistance protein
MVVVWLFDRALLGFGYNPALAAEIGAYLRATMWGTPAFLATAAFRSLLIALGHQRAVMFILIGTIGTNAALNWILIFGHLGAPALGVAGSGYATSINICISLVAQAVYVRAVPSLHQLGVLRAFLSRPWDDIRALLKVGLPIAGLMSLESSVFATSGVLMGLLGASALGAHQVVINCASITFMVPLGIAQAATVRVAHELGAGRPQVARIAGFLALGLGMVFMVLAAIALWSFPRTIIAVYVDSDAANNRELVDIAMRLLVVAALFQVVDGAQVIAAGALRGYRDTTVPMLLAAFGYWGIGFVGGWLLAFPLGLGAVGLWWGLGGGLAVVSVLLALRLQSVSVELLPLKGAAAAHT